MKLMRLSLVIFFCLFLLTAAYAAAPVKIPNLVGSWAITIYADGRIYEYPHSCLVITSQNGNLLEGMYYWHSSGIEIIPDTTVCYDSKDPLSCPAGTVYEGFADTPTSGNFSGSINANQVILQGKVSVTSGSRVFDINQIFTGLYDPYSDSANGMVHTSVVRYTDNIRDVVSNETRGHLIHSRGTICPMEVKPAIKRWLGHEYLYHE